MIINCIVCGKERKVKLCVIRLGGGKYCSRKCYFSTRKISLLIKQCLICHKEIQMKSYEYKLGRKKFCSHSCKGKYYFKGKLNPRWNGGKPKCSNCGKVLASYYAKYCLKHAKIGKRHPKWKGAQVSYAPLHAWVKRWLGKPSKCVDCNSIYNLQWANKSGEYKRDLADWISLCVSCHIDYDKKYENRIPKIRFPEKYATMS